MCNWSACARTRDSDVHVRDFRMSLFAFRLHHSLRGGYAAPEPEAVAP